MSDCSFARVDGCAKYNLPAAQKPWRRRAEILQNPGDRSMDPHWSRLRQPDPEALRVMFGAKVNHLVG